MSTRSDRGATTTGPTRRAALSGLAGALGLGVLARSAHAGNPGTIAYPGVNLSGGEFGDLGRPLGQGYIYPADSAFAYYARQGMKLVRLPFRVERLQPEAMGALAPKDLGEIARCVVAAKAEGLVLVLDAHNYGKRGDRPMEAADLADLWTRIARVFRDATHVSYGLMNEPVAFKPAAWRPLVDRTVKAIRDLGSNQLVMVPGGDWTGAHAWVSGGNAEAFADFSDGNFMIEVHQYLDPNSSGSDPQAYAPGAGAQRLRAFTEWARAHKVRAFLGEFGFALPAGQGEASALLDFMAANADVWKAYAYWAGGPWWGDYPFSIEPDKNGDKPQMALLRQYM